MTATNDVVMYGNDICPYCGAARMLFKKKGIDVTEIAVRKGTPLFDEMVEKSGRRTVPQIFIGERHVGGFDDLYALDESGELEQWLAP